jgi:hypothetical protein
LKEIQDRGEMMKTEAVHTLVLVILPGVCFGQGSPSQESAKAEAGVVTAHSGGLHGYIGFSAARPPARSEYCVGMGFYSAVWPLIDRPLADFQIGLAGCWITPDNSDNTDTPLAPEGTLARRWPERGPTWASVFQTVEGGLGYWAGNHFRYGPPKFSMNATPQCYDYEIGSPGWSFFYSNEALPDHQLGIAQLSNRLLIPPDALPFQGNPNGQYLGYTWMALPFTGPRREDSHKLADRPRLYGAPPTRRTGRLGPGPACDAPQGTRNGLCSHRHATNSKRSDARCVHRDMIYCCGCTR